MPKASAARENSLLTERHLEQEQNHAGGPPMEDTLTLRQQKRLSVSPMRHRTTLYVCRWNSQMETELRFPTVSLLLAAFLNRLQFWYEDEKLFTVLLHSISEHAYTTAHPNMMKVIMKQRRPHLSWSLD